MTFKSCASARPMLTAQAMVTGHNVTVFGFGSQGKTQALNLKDSGWNVTVYLRKESRRVPEVNATKISLVTDPVVAAKESAIVLLLLPDSAQPEFWEEVLKEHLPRGAALVFAHGYNIHYKKIVPRDDLDILLAAPSLQGDALRRHYLEKEPVPMLTAVAQDASDHGYRLVEDLARAIGGPQARLLPTTFKEETETDLFAEQAILCGGVRSLIRAGFETLVQAGYGKEIAYYCCVKELKALAALIYELGPDGFLKRISDTARYGALTRGPRVIGKPSRETMRAILDEIVSGKFSAELSAEKEAGWPRLEEHREAEAADSLEKVRRSVDG